MASASSLVSIITPAYNAASYLRETIASVQAQTYKNWEWLFADDGSTDGTLSIIEEAAAVDSRIRLVPAEGRKGSAAAARNRAMRRATGEFFAFLDADDIWEPEKTEVQAEYLNLHPEIDGVTCWYDLFGDAERISRDHRIMKGNVVVERKEVLSGSPFPTPSFLFRRRCYTALGGMDEDPRLVTGEDYEYFARFLNRYTAHRIHRVLLHVRISAPHISLTARHFSEKEVKGFSVMQVLREKGLLSDGELQRMTSRLYYTQATDNLFRYDAPYRGLLLRSLSEGSAPLQAWVMFALCFLPSPLLKPILIRLQKLRNPRIQG